MKSKLKVSYVCWVMTLLSVTGGCERRKKIRRRISCILNSTSIENELWSECGVCVGIAYLASAILAMSMRSGRQLRRATKAALDSSRSRSKCRKGA